MVCVCPTSTFGTFPAASPNALPPLHPHQGRKGMEGVFSTGVHFGVMRLAVLQKVGRQAVGSSDKVAAWDSPSPPNALYWGLKLWIQGAGLVSCSSPHEWELKACVYVFCAPASVQSGCCGPMAAPCLCIPRPCPAGRHELLEGYGGPVCVLSLSEDHWVLPVFLEVWEAQLPTKSRLGSQKPPFVHSVFSAGSWPLHPPAIESPKGRGQVQGGGKSEEEDGSRKVWVLFWLVPLTSPNALTPGLIPSVLREGEHLPGAHQVAGMHSGFPGPTQRLT